MGAWGVGPFENDDASDWVYEAMEDVAQVEAALDSIVQRDEETEKSEVSPAPTLAEGGGPNDWAMADPWDENAAVAAAALVASALDSDMSLLEELGEEVAELIDALKPRAKELASKAQKALSAVAASSEIKSLWQESDHYGEWVEMLNSVQNRLKA